MDKQASETRELAQEIGEFCEKAVTLIDKLTIPHSARVLRDKWIEERLTAYAASVTQERDALRQFLKWSRRNSYACLFWKETMGDSSPCERCAHCKMQKLGLRDTGADNLAAAAEESQPKTDKKENL